MPLETIRKSAGVQHNIQPLMRIFALELDEHSFDLDRGVTETLLLQRESSARADCNLSPGGTD